MDKKIDVSYPLDLIESLKDIPKKRVGACSVLLNNKEIGGIIIASTSQDLKYFNISPTSLPEPPLKFRMINFKNEVYLIEIWMLFGEKNQKCLKIHLNPHEKAVQHLLKLCVKTNMISFHFFDVNNYQLTSAFTYLNDDETDWVRRNNTLSARLQTDHFGYLLLAEYQAKTIVKTEKIYNYLPQNEIDFFVRNGGIQVKLSEISELL